MAVGHRLADAQRPGSRAAGVDDQGTGDGSVVPGPWWSSGSARRPSEPRWQAAKRRGSDRPALSGDRPALRSSRLRSSPAISSPCRFRGNRQGGTLRPEAPRPVGGLPECAARPGRLGRRCPRGSAAVGLRCHSAGHSPVVPEQTWPRLRRGGCYWLSGRSSLTPSELIAPCRQSDNYPVPVARESYRADNE